MDVAWLVNSNGAQQNQHYENLGVKATPMMPGQSHDCGVMNAASAWRQQDG